MSIDDYHEPTEEGICVRLDVSVADGKYRVIMEDNGRLRAYRNGGYWRDLTGDKMVYSLAAEVAELRAHLLREPAVQPDTLLQQLDERRKVIVEACDYYREIGQMHEVVREQGAISELDWVRALLIELSHKENGK